ncbi:MAG: isoprenylcysteine carboxylmethyltransferase family protein [Paracoccaceae bacterium]
MKLLDWPPIWLVGFLVLVFALDRMVPFGIMGPGGRWIGAGLVVGGIVLMLLAVGQMSRARTTVIPRRQPDALVTTGIFQWSRNPIYLGDAMVLAGAILWWDVPLAAPLLVVFMGVIERRFILGEEARLRAGFGPAFEAWAARVRRWI